MMSATWTSAQVHSEIKAALSIREAGNQAFRSGDYKLSTEKYREACYDILWLKGQRYTGAIPKSDWSIVEAITEAQFITQSNAAASWLKYDTYDGVDNRFLKALGCTSTAQEALRDHPATRWKPSATAMRKLLYRRALACEGLEDYDDAWNAVQEAHRLVDEKYMAVCELGTRIWKVRQYGKDSGLDQGFMPLEPDFFSKPYKKENYDRLKRCRLCDP